MENIKYMVWVSCMTFNQATYIEDAMNGFCMQETNFPFLCTIIDDASTDGEQEVIKNYLKAHFDLEDSTVVRNEDTVDYYLTFAQHKTNKNCYFAVLFLKYNHYSIKKPKAPYIEERCDTKYKSICEGDDYWTNPLKLQKQVDFMEKHPQHSLCFCAYESIFPSGEKHIEKRYMYDVEKCPIEDIIMGGGGYMATNSMLFRNSLFVPYRSWAIGCPVGDLPLMLTLAHKGFVGYLAEVMCAYRVSTEGSWTAKLTSNRKLRHNHHKAIIRMWKQFDKWTNKQYHNFVLKKIRINRWEHLVNELAVLKNKLLK